MEVGRALPEDLGGVRAVAESYGDLANWPVRPDYLDHELEHGALWVARDEGLGVMGFAGVLERGDVAYLADLFVAKGRVGQGIGKALLEAAFAASAAPVRATSASSDPRALPLYVRFGMRPLAPLLYLSAERAVGLRMPVDGPDGDALEERPADDPYAVALDAATSGRSRSEEFAFLARVGAVSVSLRGDVGSIASTVIRFTRVVGSIHAQEAFVAPSSAVDEGTARRGLLVAVREAATRADLVHVVVPGPHPALTPLLATGFRVVERDIVMSSNLDLFDLARYAPSPDLG